MEIARHGAYANHGEVTRKVPNTTFHFMNGSQKVQIKSANAVRVFNTGSTHRYYVRLDPSEIRRMISSLCDAFPDMDPGFAKSDLRPMVPDLLKLANQLSSL